MRSLSRAFACSLLLSPALAADSWADIRALGLDKEFAKARLASTKPLTVSAPGSDVWQACTDLPVLKETCIGIYVDEANLTLGVDLSIDGHNFSLPLAAANSFCMKDTDLLKLIELIPALLPFKPAIDKIIAELGKIPVHVLSICAALSDVNFTKTEVDGDASLDTSLMCFLGKCLYDGKYDFGHFRIPV